MRNLARPAARLTLFTFSCVLAAVAAEIALRVARPQFTLLGTDFYAADPELGFRLRPDHDGVLEGVGEFRVRVRTDALGLRAGDGAESPGPLDGRPRVLGVGDSFAFGWGVEEEETFLALASLAAGAAPLNAGVPNYSACQAAALAARLLPRLHPRVVLVALFSGNDELDELEPLASYRVEDGRLRAAAEPPRSGPRRLARALADRSHLVRAVRNSRLGAALWRRLGAPPRARERLLRHELEAYREPPPAEILAADERIGACLERLRDGAAQEQARVLAVLVPSDLAVAPGALDAAAAELGEPGARYGARAPAERLAIVLAGAGIPALDLHPALAEFLAAGSRAYYPQDRHLDARGHALAARLLAPRLADLLGSASPGTP